MADIVDECRLAAHTLGGWAAVSGPDHWQPSTIAGHLTKSALEVEKLRKEVKLLKARNAALVARNLILAFLFVGAVCGSFMVAFLSQ